MGRSDRARARRADVRTSRSNRTSPGSSIRRPAAGASVVSHDAKPDGTEPTLEAHFFDRVRPLIETALRDNRKDTWPVMVLHLDFKTNEPAHHQAIWELLGKYESWLTTAERVADEQRVTPFTPGPLLVLTEAGQNQVDTLLHARSGRRQAAALRHRPAGDVPGGHHRRGARGRRRLGAAGRAHPDRRDQLPALDQLPLGGRRARRAEQGRSVDQRRRPAAARDRVAGPRDGLVGAVLHPQRPLRCRQGKGWTASYNFGSLAAVRERMAAARDAGVEFIASDQYEELGARAVPGSAGDLPIA